MLNSSSSCSKEYRKKSLVLRKGAWTAEEDMLLKKCIEEFGEGKWHLVPLRAGLNRCRKSCRLRWLNYLRPNIKRGGFDEYEVDLMLRLHKLLGNRWSLIAGRIPGRTANDVKNYWNTHLRTRPKQQKEDQHKHVESSSQHTTVTIIKPKARTFSKTLNLHPQIIKPHESRNMITSSNDDGIMNNSLNTCPGLVSSPTLSEDKINEYLDELFDDGEKEAVHEVGWSLFDQEDGDGKNSFFDFSMDQVDIWDILASQQL